MKVIFKNSSLKFQTYDPIEPTIINNCYINNMTLTALNGRVVLYYEMEANTKYILSIKSNDSTITVAKVALTTTIPVAGLTVDSRQYVYNIDQATQSIVFQPTEKTYVIVDCSSGSFDDFEIGLEYD